MLSLHTDEAEQRTMKAMPTHTQEALSVLQNGEHRLAHYLL